jgi:hypothetical protein
MKSMLTQLQRLEDNNILHLNCEGSKSLFLATAAEIAETVPAQNSAPKCKQHRDIDLDQMNN